MTLYFRIESQAEGVHGFRYLWAKNVRGFSSGRHCAGCLIGEYDKAFGLAAPVNRTVAMTGHPIGAIVYFCGVAVPYRWEKNAHLAVRVTGDRENTVTLELHTGDKLIVIGAERLAFDGAIAKAAYPDRGKAFLTCRNFQFGAALRAGEFKADELGPL
jgi:hypothetical protein